MPSAILDGIVNTNHDEILLIDDRPENLLALESVLASERYQTVKADSARSALKYLLENSPSVILLDVQMPEIDGFETATLIRQNPRTQNIPIIFITALDEDYRHLQKAYAAGAIDFIQKPIDPEVLKAKVSILVKLARTTRDLVKAERALKVAENNQLRKELAELELINLKIQQVENKRYKDLVNSLDHVIVWTCDPSTGQAKFISDNASKALGIHEADSTDLSLLLLRLSGISQSDLKKVASTKVSIEKENSFTDVNGESRWYSSIVHLYEDSAGLPEIRGLSLDISTQKKLEQQLSDQNATSDLLIEVSQILNSTLSLEIGISEVLQRLRKSGFSYVSTFINDFGGATRFESHEGKQRQDARSYRIPIEIKNRLIGSFTFELESFCRFNFSSKAYLELQHFISSFVESCFLHEEANKAIRLRDDFLSVASHELRTPLTPLKLQSQLLRRFLTLGSDDHGQKEKTEKALSNFDKQLDKLSCLVNELLDISRFSSGKMSINCSRFDLVEMAQQTLERFHTQLQKSGCEVQFETSHNQIFVSLDEGRIDQVFTNLLTNAIKYGSNRPIRISLSKSFEGNAFELVVEDQGIGIAEADTSRIFERFERAVESRSITGLGLGLYIVRQIVEAHGGTIRVESELSIGSRFIVNLPLELQNQQSPELNYIN